MAKTFTTEVDTEIQKTRTKVEKIWLVLVKKQTNKQTKLLLKVKIG